MEGQALTVSINLSEKKQNNCRDNLNKTKHELVKEVVFFDVV